MACGTQASRRSARTFEHAPPDAVSSPLSVDSCLEALTVVGSGFSRTIARDFASHNGFTAETAAFTEFERRTLESFVFSVVKALRRRHAVRPRKRRVVRRATMPSSAPMTPSTIASVSRPAIRTGMITINCGTE